MGLLGLRWVAFYLLYCLKERLCKLLLLVLSDWKLSFRYLEVSIFFEPKFLKNLDEDFPAENPIRGYFEL